MLGIMGDPSNRSMFLKMVLAFACGLMLVAATAVTAGAKNPSDGRQVAKLTRGAAIDRALKVGQKHVGRSVMIDRTDRLGRTAFGVVVGWTKRPPIGTQDCLLAVIVKKKRQKTVARPVGPVGCGSLRPHKDSDKFLQQGPGPKYCPSNVENSWNAKALEGKTLEQAETIAAGNGCEVRVMRQDGVDLAGTADFRFNRLNVEVEGPDPIVLRILSVG